MDLFGLGAPEILLILFLILFFFGKDKLPDMARSIGRSMRELKSGFIESLGDKDSTKKKS